MTRYHYYLLLIFSIGLIIACNPEENEPDGDKEYEGYTLVWSEEFNENISTANWVYELGDGTDYGLAPGWGNAEKQIYTSSSQNSLIIPDDGNSVLGIFAKKEAGEYRYSSAKLTTQGLQSFRFGRIEARIKVPQGQGLWPAFWLLGDNITEVDWPGCGEIDIMEVIGHQPNVVHGSTHYTNSENRAASTTQGYDSGENLSEGYHVYRLDWTNESMIFSVDDNVIQETFIEEDMKEFLRPHYIILNVAVGGNWPGLPDESTVFPQTMYVDWVRYYSIDDFVAPDAPALDIDAETIGSVDGELAQHALNDERDQFGDVVIKAYGDGGEPTLSSSSTAINGDSSLLLSYPGGSWGGAFFILDPVIDFSSFADKNLFFSISADEGLEDLEIKLESVATAASVFLVDYTGTDVGNGFVEYSIPLADFMALGLELNDFKIPVALWNPKDVNGEYWIGDVLLDNVYFE